MEPELTREEALISLALHGVKPYLPWYIIECAAKQEIVSAPENIRRALALEAKEDWSTLAWKNRAVEAEARADKAEARLAELDKLDVLGLHGRTIAAEKRVKELEAQYANEVARCVDAENQNGALRMKLAAVIAAAKGDQ